MDNQNPQDPNQSGMGGGMPADQGQGDQGQAPVADPNAGQPAPETPAEPTVPSEEPVSQEPGMPAGDTGTSEDQNGQNPAGGAPVM